MKIRLKIALMPSEAVSLLNVMELETFVVCGLFCFTHFGGFPLVIVRKVPHSALPFLDYLGTCLAGVIQRRQIANEDKKPLPPSSPKKRQNNHGDTPPGESYTVF